MRKREKTSSVFQTTFCSSASISCMS